MPNLKRVLAVVGDPNDINTWSNIPYFFLQAGQAAGFLHQGLPLQPQKLKVQRLLWNGWQQLTTGHHGGFQYSAPFRRQLFAQIPLDPGPLEIISHFPLLPPRPWSPHWRVTYYLDATTCQVFGDYGLGNQVSPTMRQIALEQERLHYQQADRIVCMSPWAAYSVVTDYGIPAHKVHVIPGGANLDEAALPAIFPPDTPPPLQPLRLGFVGKDWQRKGLPFLLCIADALRQRQIEVEVIVAGPPAQELPAHPALRSVGFIDKRHHLADYVALVQSFHFGCLFSEAEAFGISNLECLRLGIPVLAHRVGGIPATVPDGLGHLFPLGTSPQVVADCLAAYLHRPETYQALRKRVAQQAPNASWQTTIQKFIQLWAGSPDFAYDCCYV
jgi:glycosyltransferase involved in cell wall biosynthesis